MKNKNLLYFAIFLVIYEFSTYAANDMIMPGMLKVVQDFGAPISFVALSLSVYLIGDSILQLILGPLADRFGKRRTIIIGATMFLIFNAFLALSPNIKIFMWGRFFQGSCMAFIAMGYAIIHESFNDKTAVKLTALMSNISILAPLIGPVIGGSISSIMSWRYVFVVSALTGAIALYGLIKYSPYPKHTVAKLALKTIIRNYQEIFCHPIFMTGTLAVTIMIIPVLLWIAIAPTMIMHTQGLAIKFFMLYQVIAIGGIMVNSIVIQFTAGRVKMATQIKLGICLCTTGLAFSLIFYKFILLVSLGMFCYTFGLGFCNAIIFRVIGKLEVVSNNMLFSMMSFIQTLLMGIGVELVNKIIQPFNYNTLSFTISCLIFGLLGAWGINRFAQLIAFREWQ